MQSFFFPCTALIPSFDQNFVRFGNISVHKRLWNTTIFDLATLESRHHLHLPRPLMELFLPHSSLEIEIRSETRENAQRKARIFQVMLYLQDTSTFLMPFLTNHSYNEYSGINSRDSTSLIDNLPEGMRAGIDSTNSKIEAWNHDASLWCMPSFGSRNISEDLVEAAVRDCEIWPKIEKENKSLAVARLALQTAPIIPDSGSSLLHIWQGIESIFNVSSEVTFRTSILIAQLTSNILNPSITYDLARQSYGTRSKAAHGSIKSISQKDWHDAWHLLTLCVKAVIMRTRLPSIDELMKELLEKSD